MSWLTLLLYGLFALGTLGMTWAATGAVLGSLRARAILDHPNDRSSHTTPTPRGAGLAVVGVTLLAWCLVAALTGALGLYWPVFLAALALAAISWRDDLHGLPAWPRLIAQALAVAATRIEVFTVRFGVEGDAEGHADRHDDAQPPDADGAARDLARLDRHGDQRRLGDRGGEPDGGGKA